MPASKVHALDRNRTRDLSVRRPTLYPLSQTGFGSFYLLSKIQEKEEVPACINCPYLIRSPCIVILEVQCTKFLHRAPLSLPCTLSNLGPLRRCLATSLGPIPGIGPKLAVGHPSHNPGPLAANCSPACHPSHLLLTPLLAWSPPTPPTPSA
uniref:Uncharacterized protein n=1 Tax=Pipistrellus kuhlii TaxID=59472 RepID=A0A7J8B203_PIPKU|nr:hypothetical protein mPipKuh1_007873 [Pipistrellus kuhlii]